MRNRYVLSAVIFFLIVCSLSAGEVATVWSRLYKRAQSLSQKYEIMLTIVEQHDRDTAPVLMDALSELVLGERNLVDQNERSLNAELERIIIRELGNLKASESASTVMTIVKDTKDNFLRGEALVALGKMGAREYSGDIAMILRNLNSGITKIQNKQEEETVVKGCVSALERMKSPVGFEPVFFASVGRYAREIRLLAQEALVHIIEDPSAMLVEIVEKDGSLEVKYQALLAGKRSKAGPEGKNSVALAALKASLLADEKSQADKNVLKQMRIDALGLMRDTGIQSDDNVVYMEQMISNWRKYRLYSEDEMLAILDSLGAQRGDLSAGTLAAFLKYQTEQRESGRTPESLRIVKATISAMARTGNPKNIEELTVVTYAPSWEADVKREAKKALDALK